MMNSYFTILTAVGSEKKVKPILIQRILITIFHHGAVTFIHQILELDLLLVDLYAATAS